MMSNADLLASKISEAALKFGWLEQLDPASKQEPNDPNALQALMAGSNLMASNQAARDDVSIVSRGNTSVVSRGNVSVASRGNASVASRHSTASSRGSNHDISDMEPTDILEMARSLVTLPCDALLVGEAEQREMIEAMLAAPVGPPPRLNDYYDDDDDEEEDFEDPFAQDAAEANAKNRRASDQVLTALAALLLADENEAPENDQQRRRRGKDSRRGGNAKPKRSRRRNPKKQQQKLNFDDSTIATDSSSYKSPRSVCSATVPSDSDLLAKGWKKAWDSGCGRYYFYTVDHSQVVWENPLESHDDWFSTDDEKDAFAQDPFSQEEDPFALDPFDLVEEET